MKSLKEFYKGKNVFITGHTGFKGSWMCRVLQYLGANITGYALKSPTNPALFDLCHFGKNINSIEGDIRDLENLKNALVKNQPEIVIHMAAQPLVKESYKNPVYTYDTNIMGTVNVLECVRLNECVKSFVNVTTDKVYLNKEWEWGYRENEELNGYDPYSNSKSCSELVTSSYVKSFFYKKNVAISTCRAGNVIGGGDFSADRIIPDCVRFAISDMDIVVRNPFSIRPYQHVLESVIAYLMVAQKQYENVNLAGSYNIGPDDVDCWSTGKLVDQFCCEWEKQTGKKINWIDRYDGGPHEARFLKLDCSKIKHTFSWKPTWNVEKTMKKIIEWYVFYIDGEDVCKCMDRQIEEFLFKVERNKNV